MHDYEEEDYGREENYSDVNEYYPDYSWDRGYEKDNLDDLIQDYENNERYLENELKKKRKDSTKAPIQQELETLRQRKEFLKKLKSFHRKWNPKPNQITNLKTTIDIMENELRKTNVSLNKCRKQESINERQDKINLLSKTITIYKKSFALLKKKGPSAPKPNPSSKPEKRMSTKPVPTEKRIPLPEKDDNWSAAEEFGQGLKSAFSWGWWGTSSAAKGIVRGGNSLYSTFRNSPESAEKVEKQHEQIDKETEQKNEDLVQRVEQSQPEITYSEDDAEIFNLEETKTQIINLGIEKNNLEGEKRKEEATRQEHEKLNFAEEEKRALENVKREREERERQEEEKKREKNIIKNLKDLGSGLVENEDIRVENEDERQMNEDTRQMNEDERQQKEETRQTFENLRQEDEKIRQTLDDNRKIYWENMLIEKENWLKEMNRKNNVFNELIKVLDKDEVRRQNLDKQINQNEDKRLENETVRMENEKDRRDEEEKRIENEKKRIEAENARVRGESQREKNEENRIEEEEKRFTNEDERILNEKTRISIEKIRVSSEKERINNEKKRENFYGIASREEGKRVEGEKGRVEREKIFQQEELKRQAGEKLRIQNDERRNWIQEQNLKILNERKNKLDEIEMKYKKKPPQKTYETYFTNRENTTEWIEDQKFKEKVNKILDNIEENKPETYYNALLDGISQMEDITLTEQWERKIFLAEKEKFEWEGRIKVLNEALFLKNIVINPTDPNVVDFLRKNLKDSKTPVSDVLNGFFYKDKKIIKRNIKKEFIPNIKEAKEAFENFVFELGKVNQNASSVISNEVGVFADPEINREFAESYIQELREEQKKLIREGKVENGEFFEMQDFNAIGEEIENIRKNKYFKVRPKIWARSFGGFVSRFIRYLKLIFKRHGVKIIIGLSISGIGACSSYIIFGNFLKKIGDHISKLKEEVPKYFKEDLLKTLEHYFGKHYGYILGSFLGVIAFWGRKFLLGFTSSVVYLSADVIGMLGKTIYSLWMVIVGPLAYIVGGKILENFAYYGYKMYEESYYMSNSKPPQKLITRRAEDENMTPSEYKKKFVNENRYYNSTLASVASYPVSVISLGTGIAADKSKEAVEWVFSWGIILGVIIGIGILIYILIKWRN